MALLNTYKNPQANILFGSGSGKYTAKQIQDFVNTPGRSDEEILGKALADGVSVDEINTMRVHPRLAAQPGQEGRVPTMQGNDVTAAARQFTGDERTRESRRARDENAHSVAVSGHRVEDASRRQSVRGEQIVVRAVVVDEPVLQCEHVEAADGLAVPGELLGLRRQPALGRMLLDDDHVLVSLQRIDDTGAVERLERMHRHERDRLALLPQAVGDGRRHLQ